MQGALALGGQRHADDPLITVVDLALDEPQALRSVDQLDSTVMADQQVLGDITDGRSARVAPDGEEQLMLWSGEADCLSLLFAPSQERAETVAEVEQAPEVLVGESRFPIHIVTRYYRRR